MDYVPVVQDRLTRDRVVLVVIDLQDRFKDLIVDMDQVLARTKRMITMFQQLEIPIVVTEHYPRGLGHTVVDIKEVCLPFEPIEKIHFSCFGSDDFAAKLKELGRDQIILCGIETHVCVYQTAGDLLRDGKQVVVVADAVSSCSAENRDLGLNAIAQSGAQVLGAQMVMFELLERAGTPEFKSVSSLLPD